MCDKIYIPLFFTNIYFFNIAYHACQKHIILLLLLYWVYKVLYYNDEKVYFLF